MTLYLMKMMTKTFKGKRYYFSLLELLVVLFLASMVTVFVGINIKKSWDEEIYRSSLNKLANKMRLSQDLMLYQNCDVRLTFRKVKSTIYCHMELLGDCSPETFRNFWEEQAEEGSSTSKLDDEERRTSSSQTFKKTTALPGIATIEMEIDPPYRIAMEDIEIAFTSPGGKMTRGILILSNDKDEKEASLTYCLLKGYPSPLIVKTEYPLLQEDNNEPFHEHYPKEIQES